MQLKNTLSHQSDTIIIYSCKGWILCHKDSLYDCFAYANWLNAIYNCILYWPCNMYFSLRVGEERERERERELRGYWHICMNLWIVCKRKRKLNVIMRNAREKTIDKTLTSISWTDTMNEFWNLTWCLTLNQMNKKEYPKV